MKINGTDIRTFGARQFKVVIGHHDMKNSSEWLPSAVLPYFSPLTMNFKTITVTVNIKCYSRERIIERRSKLLAALLGTVDLELSGFEHKFKVQLTGHRETEVVKDRWHQLELTFNGYEYGDDVVFTGTSSITVKNPGTLPSPCVVEITPTFGSSQIIVGGICRSYVNGDDLPVTIKSLTTGSKVTLNGITGLITEGTALKEVDAWALPSMLPGENTVTCDDSHMNISITVTPIYM